MTWAAMVLVCLGIVGPLVGRAGGEEPAPVDRMLDDFENPSAWTTLASEGSSVELVPEPGFTGAGLRVNYTLQGTSAFAIVRRELPEPLRLPENFAFTLRLRGEGPPVGFEFKLVSPSGDDVWRRVQRGVGFTQDWQPITIRRSRLEHAWGPGSGSPRQVGAIEIALTAGEGGHGTLWIDDLRLEERAPANPNPPEPTVAASSSLPEHEAARVLDRDPETVWRSRPLPAEQWLLVDLGQNRELGGLVIDWDREDYATAFEVETSVEGEQWDSGHVTTTGHGGRSWIYLPDAESRFVRIVMRRSSLARGYGVRELRVEPFEFSASPNRFFEAIARNAPPGTYPKYFQGKQTYWTLVGVEGGTHEAFLNEEGMLEVAAEAFSLEPFLYADGKLVTWHDVQRDHRLEDGDLPIPSVVWRYDGLTLTVTAFADGPPDSGTVYASYRIANARPDGVAVRLFLAVRPFQVNPPWQTLMTSGGVSRIDALRWEGRTLHVNDDRIVALLTPPDRVGAASFEEGMVTDFLLDATVPPRTTVSDDSGFASGALQYNRYLAPGTSDVIDVAVPFGAPGPRVTEALTAPDAHAFVEARHEAVKRHWRTLLARVDVALPGSGMDVVRALRATLAYMHLNRDGASLQPGSRNYARAWIRDGAMSSQALLQMAFPREVADFLRWYAGFQGPGGKVPCCIDSRGPDPVPEHDGPGAFIFGIAEYYRYTGDVGLVSDLWSNVTRAFNYLTNLRSRSLQGLDARIDPAAFRGLLPASISHEGYSSHPVHSYWDDLFALRGMDDAVLLATVMGDDEARARMDEVRNDFRRALGESMARTMAVHRIDYVPGSVELGDFDPTSTALALVLDVSLPELPPSALPDTFERYWRELERRWADPAGTPAYSPYEARNIEAFVRLGSPSRAHALLDAILADRRPAGWNAWAEVVWRDPDAPRFIGDMPHTWVGADFARSVRSMIAYERTRDEALVVGAGLRADWLTTPPGVVVKRLPTHHGVLRLEAFMVKDDVLRVRLGGDLTVPPGGVVVASPLPRPVTGAGIDGVPVVPGPDGTVTVRALPAEVELVYAPMTASGG
jgi:hypothetical protein